MKLAAKITAMAAIAAVAVPLWANEPQDSLNQLFEAMKKKDANTMMALIDATPTKQGDELSKQVLESVNNAEMLDVMRRYAKENIKEISAAAKKISGVTVTAIDTIDSETVRIHYLTNYIDPNTAPLESDNLMRCGSDGIWRFLANYTIDVDFSTSGDE